MAKPLVTGISPAEGPPGTLVKIRGENLGKNAKDLLGVFICKVNCTYTADWHATYIQCRSGTGLGLGDIIVVTKSGGTGTSTVQFRGFMPRVGLLTESAIWVDESKLFEEKPSASGMPSSRSLSPTMLIVDPLGVAPEESGNLLPADTLEDMYPKCSGNTLAENFLPARFLLERHLDTSFASLKSGYLHLESHNTRWSSSGPSSFIRKNLGTILESLDTLKAVKNAMNRDESEIGRTSICEEMEGILESCNSEAKSMFHDILTRKDEADVKRNAVSVLQRFKFLFNLQKNIDWKIQQGDYEIVISDYNRAKTFIQNTEVKCFQKVLKDVDARISTFVTQLQNKLFEFPSSLEERKRLIRYLNDLDYPGDPAWECIEKMHSWLVQVFLTCKEDHQKSESSSKFMSPPTSSTDVRATRLDSRMDQYTCFPGHTRTASDGGKSALPLQQLAKKKANSRAGSVQGSGSEAFISGTLEGTPLPRVLFILKLCDLLVTNLPEFWKLGQAYLLGQLRKKVSQIATEDELSKKESKFSRMVKSIIKLFDGLVRAIVSPDSLIGLNETDRANYGGWQESKSSAVPWLPKCARTIRSSWDSLKLLTIPSELLASLRKLSTDICLITVQEVLQAALVDVKALYDKEDWELDYDEQSNCISLLPGLFNKMFINSLHFVKEFMSQTRIDSKQEQSNKLKEQVAESLKSMVKAFIDTLMRVLADHLQQETIKVEGSILPGPNTASTSYTALSLEERLLILLSNTSYLRNTLLPALGERCKQFGYEELENLAEEFTPEIEKAEAEVLSTYIEIKGEPLVGSIEQGMSLGEYRWDEDIPIIGVRAYVREVIMSLVVIHDQVSSISLTYVPIVFAKLGNILSEEIKRIFECQQKFSRTGTIQAHLELSVFQSSLSQYLSATSTETFEGARKVLPALKDGSSKVVQDLVGKFNKEMAYQLSCFTLVDPTPEEPPVEMPKGVPLKRVEFNPFMSDDEEETTMRQGTSKPKKLVKMEDKTPEEKQPVTKSIDIPGAKDRDDLTQKLSDGSILSLSAKGRAPLPPKSKVIAPSPPQGKGIAPTPPKSKTKAPSPPVASPGTSASKEKARAPSPPKPRSVSTEAVPDVQKKTSLAKVDSSNPFLDSEDEAELESTNPFL